MIGTFTYNNLPWSNWVSDFLVYDTAGRLVDALQEYDPKIHTQEQKP